MKKIIFWGTPEFSVPALGALLEQNNITAVVTQPAKPQGRGRKKIEDSPVKKLADEYSIPVLTPETLDSAFEETLRPYLPATFLVIAYGKIIPERILALSELPPLNVHPSLLPDLRGPSPIQTALLNGYSQTGLTLMVLDEKMDHGPIVAQKKVRIADDDMYPQLSEKLGLTAAQFVAKYVPLYLNGSLHSVPQDHTRARFSKMIKASDGILDFDKPATELLNVIRAYTPWPGAYFVWNKKRVKILGALAVNEKPAKQFSRTADGRLRIACRTGALDVLQVQHEGKKAVSALDFLNGYPSIVDS